MKKVIIAINVLFLVSVAFISFSCDEIISPELADKKVTVTFDLPDTVNIRIFKNYRQLHELTGYEKSVVLRPGSYGLEFYTNYFFYAENLNVIEDRILNFNSKIDSITTARINFDVPDSVNVKISKENQEVVQFKGSKEIKLKKGIYLLQFTSSFLSFDTLMNLQNNLTVIYDQYLNARTARIDFQVPDSVSVRIRQDSTLMYEFRGNKSIRLKKGLYNIVFAGYYFQFSIYQNIDQSAIINYLEYFMNIVRGLIFVRGGTFQMGSNNGDSDEKPVHNVTLSDFYIAKNEVTQGLWKSVMGNNPSYFASNDNLPVENISWYDAVIFCNELSENDGLQKVYSGSGSSIMMNMNANGYRLPTEAEWEYAARGGNLSKGYDYSGSNSAGDVAWYWDNSGGKTHPVGQKQPNELGIYDMSGNVWEWCWDWKGYYSSESQTNPIGPSSGSYRVLRGGGCGNSAGSLRPAFRYYSSPGSRYIDLGFRLLRSK